MLKKIGLFLLLLYMNNIVTLPGYLLGPKRKTLSGRVQFPKLVESIPTLELLYKGRYYTLEEGYYELYDDIMFDINEPFIVITQSIKKPTNCEIGHLETSPHHPYRIFKMTKSTKTVDLPQENASMFRQKQWIEYWHIEELPAQKNRSLTDNTIIVFMDPDYIDTLKEESWLRTDNILKLPLIVFKDSVTEQDLDLTAARMACALPDFKPFHSRSTKTMLLGNNRILALPNSNNRYLS